jgi:adenylate cyclase
MNGGGAQVSSAAMEALIPTVLVSLVALGMAVAFFSADRKSPTSRALAVTLALIGLAIVLNGGAHELGLSARRYSGWLALPEAAAMIAVLEWLLRVRRTIPAGALDTRGGDWMLRLGQLSGASYALLAMLAPELRARDFQFAATNADSLSRPGFWLFAGPILFACLAGLLSILLLLRRQPDRPERVRVFGVAASMPFFVSGFVLPESIAAVTVLLGEMIMLIGATQYHVLQGQRGQFMSRFLSTQVADLVRRQGIEQAMERNSLEITVVVSDLRGFTAYAGAQPSARVIEVLRDYYDAVGAVVAEYGGTIKDYAGDGILILVGAPLPIAEHARIGLQIAHRVRDAAGAITDRWATGEHRLGIGVGVASGTVTVGIIGGASRLEYTAVGPAVNLASRLCEQAADREILIDGRTSELAADARLEPRPPLQVKGFAMPVSLYALPVAGAAA